MFIKDIRLLNFRNHKNLKVDFDKTTYISGFNGSGKTSIAEAVSVILNLKSFKQSNLKKCIKFEESGFFLESNILKGNEKDKISLKYQDTKYLCINGNPEKKISDYLSDNFVFIYSPFNEGILSTSQETRRSFVDKVIFYKFPQYINILKEYNKILNIKKKLFLGNKVDQDYLNILNEKFLKLSIDISEMRNIKILKLNSILSDNFTGMFKGETFGIKFTSKKIDSKIFKDEIIKRSVLFGAHLDKIYYTLGGRVNDGFLSFGQRKTFALLCIKVVLLSLEDLIKNGIILLLDDFEVGLDAERIAAFKYIFKDSQLIITGVENNHFKDAHNIRI